MPNISGLFFESPERPERPEIPEKSPQRRRQAKQKGNGVGFYPDYYGWFMPDYGNYGSYGTMMLGGQRHRQNGGKFGALFGLLKSVGKTAAKSGKKTSFFKTSPMGKRTLKRPSIKVKGKTYKTPRINKQRFSQVGDSFGSGAATLAAGASGILGELGTELFNEMGGLGEELFANMKDEIMQLPEKAVNRALEEGERVAKETVERLTGIGLSPQQQEAVQDAILAEAVEDELEDAAEDYNIPVTSDQPIQELQQQQEQITPRAFGDLCTPLDPSGTEGDNCRVQGFDAYNPATSECVNIPQGNECRSKGCAGWHPIQNTCFGI